MKRNPLHRIQNRHLRRLALGGPPILVVLALALACALLTQHGYGWGVFLTVEAVLVALTAYGLGMNLDKS